MKPNTFGSCKEKRQNIIKDLPWRIGFYLKYYSLFSRSLSYVRFFGCIFEQHIYFFNQNRPIKIILLSPRTLRKVSFGIVIAIKFLGFQINFTILEKHSQYENLITTQIRS